jgi:hypothetical protein
MIDFNIFYKKAFYVNTLKFIVFRKYEILSPKRKNSFCQKDVRKCLFIGFVKNVAKSIKFLVDKGTLAPRLVITTRLVFTKQFPAVYRREKNNYVDGHHERRE